MLEACRMFLWYRAMSRGPTQEERENMVNELLRLEQRALPLATHTVNEHGIIVKMNNNAGNDQIGHGEEDNASNKTLHDRQSQDKKDVQS